MSCTFRLHRWQEGRVLDRCLRCGFTWPVEHRWLRPALGEGRPLFHMCVAGLDAGIGVFALGDGKIWQGLGLLALGAGAMAIAGRTAVARETREEVIEPGDRR